MSSFDVVGLSDGFGALGQTCQAVDGVCGHGDHVALLQRLHGATQDFSNICSSEARLVNDASSPPWHTWWQNIYVILNITVWDRGTAYCERISLGLHIKGTPLICVRHSYWIALWEVLNSWRILEIKIQDISDYATLIKMFLFFFVPHESLKFILVITWVLINYKLKKHLSTYCATSYIYSTAFQWELSFLLSHQLNCMLEITT